MSGSENERRPKRSNSCDGQEKISYLPEAVLCHILSRISFKEAVRTSILGTRWKDLWAAMPNLEFDFKSMYYPNGRRSDSKEKLNEYMNFVERGLILRDGLNIKKFVLSCFEVSDFPSIYAWICNAITCNVQELDVRISVHPYAQLPWSLLTCKTLVVLKLSGRFILNVPTNIYLPSLTILHLRSLVYLDDISVRKLFSSCPILEELEVVRSDWDNVRCFIVKVPSLRRLSLCFDPVSLEFKDCRRHKIVVDTPNLEYLKLCDHVSEAFLFNNLPYLVEADLDVQLPHMSSVFHSIFVRRVIELLARISSVKFLSLSSATLHVLGFFLGDDIPTFDNLVHLKLGIDRTQDWYWLPNLLVSSPKLEVLHFEEGLVDVKNPNDYDRQFRSMPSEVPECLFMCLKSIEICKFVGKADEVKLIKYFLKNATVLVNMTIRCHCLNVVWNIREKLLVIQDELCKSPRGSSACQIKFIV